MLLAAAIAIAGCRSDDATVAVPKPIAAGSGAGGALVHNARLADRIVGDGSAAFAQRMAALRGHPVVVNQWASWCDSCRFELPFFRTAVRRYGDRVAFVGLDSEDERGAAEAFLREMPVGFRADDVVLRPRRQAGPYADRPLRHGRSARCRHQALRARRAHLNVSEQPLPKPSTNGETR